MKTVFEIEDSVLGLRKFHPDDERMHREMTKQRSISGPAFEKLYEQIKKDVSEGLIVLYTIVVKDTQKVCGFCQLDMQNPQTPEFGIDILDNFMGKCYGYRAVLLLHIYASKWDGVDHFKWCCESENFRSRRLAEKLGGILEKETYMLPEKVIEFGKTAGILTDDDLSTMRIYQIPKLHQY